jgi:hypothetical protein
MEGFNMFKDFKELIYQRWFQILILLGIFILLVQPKVNIPNNSNHNSTSAWFKDYNIYGNNQPNIQTNTNQYQAIPNKYTPQEIPQVVPIYNPNSNDKLTLANNKKLIISECIRLEPDLNDWSKLNYSRKEIPTLNYLIPLLEKEFGYDYLYEDIERGVKIFMKKIGR